MRPSFPLFTTPLDLAHHFWANLLQENDTVIDATCGNGKDSLALASLLKTKKNTTLYCLDIQNTAMHTTKELLKHLTPEFLSSVHFFQMSHADIPIDLIKKTKLLVYNLGYLPGGDKSITTLTSSTTISICKAIEYLPLGGVISLTCYPGHAEGKKEEEALLSFFSCLDPKIWCFTSFIWNNRKASPSFLLVQKKQ